MNASSGLHARPAADAAQATTRHGQAGRHLVRLDDERVARYYLRHLAVAHTRRERWRAMLLPLGGAVRGWSRTRSFRRRFAPPASSPSRWEETLARARALVAGIDGLAPGIIVQDYADGGRDRTLFFLFEAKAPAPLALLKTRPAGAEGKPLAEEWRALRLLAERLPPALAATVPAPLGYGEDADVEALLVSVLPGISGYVDLRATLTPTRRAEGHLRAAAGWLAAFQAATRSPQHSLDATALIADARPRLERTGLAGSEEAGPLLNGLAELGSGPPLARVAGHGDFWVRNVLYAPRGREVAVVDWEHFAPLASPADDLLHFLVSYGVSFPRRGGVRGTDAFTRAFVAPGAVARATRRVLVEWRERHGLTGRALRALVLLHLLTRADDLPADVQTHGDAFNRARWLDCYRTIARADRSAFSG